MSSHHIGRPELKDILRYRYHHGANLGSIFVLERWLFGSMYDVGAAGSSELDAVVSYGSIIRNGLDETRTKWEAHWSSALSDEDLRWLTETARCTTIRLPIGYFTLGPHFCTNTPFSMQPAQVYVNAWTAVKRLVSRCYAHGIGVLVDLHAAPGGANNESHSGTSSRKAELWGNKLNLDLTARCLCFMAQEVASGSLDGVIGVQICNETHWDPPYMYKFYDTVIAQVSRIDPTLPIYISDGWDLGRALRYALKMNSVKGAESNPVIVDTHKYYTFAEKDTSRGPHEIIGQVSTELTELNTTSGNVFENRGASAAYVGEYSCTLSPQTWTKVSAEVRPELTKLFGDAQSERWHFKACGSAFWTMKMAWMPGGDWGFTEQVNSGAIKAPTCLYLPAAEVKERSMNAEEKRSKFMMDAVQSHTSYWDNQAPGARFEHWRFADGWHLGWTDARDFFLARAEGVVPQGDDCEHDESVGTAFHDGAAGSKPVQETASNPAVKRDRDGGDKIGALDIWVLKRMKKERCADRHTCEFGWEWEQGFRKGVSDFYAVVGV